jgi:predicted RNase H-like HicB family nuclease
MRPIGVYRLTHEQTQLSAVLVAESGMVVACCLEYFICGQGYTLQEAKDSLESAIYLTIKYRLERGYPALEGLPETPDIYHSMAQSLMS